MISKEALRETIEEAAKEVRGRKEEVSAASARLGEAERELKLLTELAGVRGVELPESLPLPAGSADADVGGSPSQAGRAPAWSKAALLTAVIEILAEHGEPMQIRDLMAVVQERGVKIPGKGQQANLIAHISRDKRIARPRRGFYALREWGVEDAKPSRSKRRRPRRRTHSAS
jgi:hypothetical protein